MKQLVGHTHNDIPVFVDLITSDAAGHIAQQPYLLALAAEALRHVTPDGTHVDIELDMGRVLGYDFVIETTAADTVFYARLARENVYTRFVKSGNPLSTQCLAIVLAYDPTPACYDLSDVWIGHLRPPRPDSSQATAKGNLYWEKHAFIFDNQPLQSRTLSKTCPY